MAMKAGYAELAGKSESYEICFIPENDYRAFLKHKVPGLEEKVEGEILFLPMEKLWENIVAIHFILLDSEKD